MITVNFTWVLNSNDPYIAGLLHDSRRIDIGELIPNVTGNPLGHYGLVGERIVHPDSFESDNLEYLENFAKWVFSHPDYNFRLTHHIYNPNHEVFENAGNVHRAFKDLEYNLLDQLLKHDRRPNVSVVSVEELVERYPGIADDPLVKSVANGTIKNFPREIESIYYIQLYHNLGDSDPRIELNIDVTPTRLNEKLEDIKPEIKQKVFHYDFTPEYCLPIEYCVDHQAFYVNGPRNALVKAIIHDTVQEVQGPDMYLGKLLNDNFLNQFGIINSEGRVFKNGVETEGILFNMKVPAGGTWNHSLEENIAHSHPVDWNAVYDDAKIDPEFNMFRPRMDSPPSTNFLHGFGDWLVVV